MKVPYRCLYNHELLILATSQTPYQSYREPLGEAQTIGLVEELRGTGVDALMICPQAWRTHLWRSEIDRRWQDDAPSQKEPLLECDLKYAEKAYFRLRRHMLDGGDPVALTVKTARQCGIAPLFSYRMNDHHFTNNPNTPTHSRFWREHPQYWLHPKGGPYNYLEPEVRAHLQQVIFELLDKHDVEGFECDFMRSAWYFPRGRESEGAPLLTQWLRELRQKLDALGNARGKRLALGVRLPLNPEICRELGLDIETWIHEGLVDMLNASPSFRLSQEVGIEAYRKLGDTFSLYGELHFVSHPGETFGGYRTSINRLTNPELYRSTALSFLERGADGVSLFNFSYTRDHSFAEVRRKHFPGIEPPFAVIHDLANARALRAGDQHLALTPDIGNALCRAAGQLPAHVHGQSSADFSLHVPDCFDTPFASALLRIESTVPISYLPIDTALNGHELEPILRHGELFQPLSLEALPDPLHLLHFRVPAEILRAGHNTVTILNNWLTSGGGAYSGRVTFVRIDLALYRNHAA